MIPPFDENGNLPPGDHEAEWEEFAERFGTNTHRESLLRGLRKAILELKKAGCSKIWIDGSFTTTKESPADYDGMWRAEGIDESLLDSVFLDANDMRYGSRMQKTFYLGELFPYNSRHEKLFRIDRAGNTKGIVTINPQRVS